LKIEEKLKSLVQQVSLTNVDLEGRRACDLVLERLLGQGSWSWNSSIKNSIRRKIRWVFPQAWRGFGRG